MDKQERNRIVCEMYTTGKTLNEITKSAEITVQTIYKILDINNIPRRRDSRMSQKRVTKKEIVKLFMEENRLPGEISEILNIKQEGILRVLREDCTDKYKGYLAIKKLNERRKKQVDKKKDIEKEHNENLKKFRKHRETGGITEKYRLEIELDDDVIDKTAKVIEKLIGADVDVDKRYSIEDIRKMKIVHQYCNGVPFEQIKRENSISSEELYYLVEASNLPEEDTSNRPPLKL